MQRRSFLAAAPAVALAQGSTHNVKFGIDLFSLRSQGWNPFAYLDYCAKQGAKVVHFSEIRFLGSLDRDHLRKVRDHAKKLAIEVEIGMLSICPTAVRFDPAQGTAEQQLARMIDAATVVDAPLVRAVLGDWRDRASAVPLEQHIDNTVKTLRAVRSRALDAGKKIAIENHGGDLQGRELRHLIEAAGKDFVGACIDSGNPTWAIEDPHVTLEVLAPYVLTSHVRDSAVWRTPEGAAMQWTRMGEGNVNIAGWVRKFAELCPGKAMSLEIIVTGTRPFPYLKPEFWNGFRQTPAWEFARFAAIAESGHPRTSRPAPTKEMAAALEREDLESSIQWLQSNQLL